MFIASLSATTPVSLDTFTVISIVVSGAIGGLSVVIAILQWRGSSKDVSIAVKQVAQAKPADIQQIAASQLELNNAYYKGVLLQSRLSFIVAIIFAAAGLGFFFIVSRDSNNPSLISITGGVLTELLSAINFYIYGRASGQLDTFHSRLDKLQFFVLANSICENLNDELKYETRAELVRSVAEALSFNDTYRASTSIRNKKENISKRVTAKQNHAGQKDVQEDD